MTKRYDVRRFLTYKVGFMFVFFKRSSKQIVGCVCDPPTFVPFSNTRPDLKFLRGVATSFGSIVPWQSTSNRPLVPWFNTGEQFDVSLAV